MPPQVWQVALPTEPLPPQVGQGAGERFFEGDLDGRLDVLAAARAGVAAAAPEDVAEEGTKVAEGFASDVEAARATVRAALASPAGSGLTALRLFDLVGVLPAVAV